MLSAAAGLWPDQDNETRQAINKIDGVSVHVLRFSDYGVPEDGSVNAIRDACRQRGWQHIVASNGKRSPIHSGTTDMWLVMDGMNVQGGGGAGGDTPQREHGNRCRQHERGRSAASAGSLRDSAR